MKALSLFNVSLLLNLLFGAPGGLLIKQENKLASLPLAPSCSRIECPGYDVIHSSAEYEIRRYNSSVWMSTSPIQDISFTSATRTGFLQLFDYIQGKNEEAKKIEMTAPVLTKILPSDGPFCDSSFVVSFYVPKENQASPPQAKGMQAQIWKNEYVAVKRFGGFVSDSDVAKEAAALQTSLAGSDWDKRVKKTTNGTSDYTVAQYNSPFEFNNRVNEIWFTFEM